MTTQKNGTQVPTKTPPATNGKKVDTTVTLKAVKPEEKPKAQTSNESPLEDRVLKVQTLFDMVTRREKLQESLKKLKSLNTSTENRNLSITIDDDATEWQTFNTDAIKACIDSMVLTIEQKIAILDSLIKW